MTSGFKPEKQEDANGAESDSESLSRYEPGDYRLGISQELARESIESNFPEFKNCTIRLFSEGLGSVVFLVNDEYVFRFPRHEKADVVLGVERAIVPKLHDYSGVPVPDFQYAGLQAGRNLHFVGYPLLRGERLTKEILYEKSDTPNPQLVKQIATFFRELHAFDLHEARASGVKERNLRRFFEGQREDARDHVYPVLRERLGAAAETMIEKIEKAFSEYLSDAGNFSYIPALIHGDLEVEHILIDPRTRDVTGIIDFGGIRVSDPDEDLWRPYFHYGKRFIEELLKNYPHENPSHLFRKMEFFWTAQIIHRTLRPILIGDEKKLKNKLPQLVERLASVVL